MFLWTVVPSWQQIEEQIEHEFGYQIDAQYQNYWGESSPSLGLTICRLGSVRSAFHQAESEAMDMLRRRFADLDISIVLRDMIDVVTQMAMIVAGSTLTGGAIGTGAGALLGGAAAIPMGAAGAAMGLQASSWILGILGLRSVAEFFVEGLPRIGEYYLTGIAAAWGGTQGAEGTEPFFQEDSTAVSSGAHHIALGHVEAVMLLLSAIVEYLTRGRGSAGALAREMRASPKGTKIGQWMVEHEDALKGRPDLQKAETHKGASSSQETPAPAPPPRSSTPSPRDLKPRRSHENPGNLIPIQDKSEVSGSQIKRLAKDMEKNGFDPNHPVDVWKNPSTGRLEIQDGHHRVAAAKRAGLDKIPVDIWE